MCTELPVELAQVRPDATARGWVGGRQAGRLTEVSLVLLDGPVAGGDWVVAHAGFAVHRISATAARDALTIRARTHPDLLPAGTLADLTAGPVAADAVAGPMDGSADAPASAPRGGPSGPADRSIREEPT